MKTGGNVPYKSAKQEQFIRHEASEGKRWAKKFVKDSEKERPKKGKKK